MIDFRVRSVSLLNLINDVNTGRLIPDAYFQRNLIWRDIHNKDFIKTILLGYPFPQLFISKGKVDIETMSTVSCIIDGQQRTNAIKSFLNNEFEVDARFYKDLEDDEKTSFLNYEIAIIELNLQNDDPKVKDIFQRINRTSNSLSTIEKLASEYSTSEYMLVAKLLTDQINLKDTDNDSSFKEDPNIPETFYDWAKKQKVTQTQKLLNHKNIFNVREISRKVNLMHTLNIMSTILVGFFVRNDKSIDLLNDYIDEFSQKDKLICEFEKVSEIILNYKFTPKSIWNTKSGFFTLFIAISNNISIIGRNLSNFKTELSKFESELPDDFKLASTEGVNNKKERELRNYYLQKIIDSLK